MDHKNISTDIKSPFLNVLSEAESVQVREVLPSSQPAIIASVEEAIKNFDQNDAGQETRNFLITIKKPAVSISPSNDVKSNPNLELMGVLKKAELLLKNEDYLLSRNLFSYVLKREIKNPAALKGLGLCLLNLGDTTAAKKCFNALVEVLDLYEGHALLGLSLIRENNDKAAFDAFSKVKDLGKLSEDLRFTFLKEYGNCLTRLERLNEASDVYHQALSINPRSHTIYINLGTLEIQRKRFDKATRYFQQAIDFCPSAAKAFCGIGIVAQMNGEDDIAELYFYKTLDIDNQNSVALHQLYAMANSENDWRNLKLRIVKALIKDPSNFDLRFLLAAILLKQNDWAGCESELNLILRKFPEHPNARLLRDELSLHRHRQGGNL